MTTHAPASQYAAVVEAPAAASTAGAAAALLATPPGGGSSGPEARDALAVVAVGYVFAAW